MLTTSEKSSPAVKRCTGAGPVTQIQAPIPNRRFANVFPEASAVPVLSFILRRIVWVCHWWWWPPSDAFTSSPSHSAKLSFCLQKLILCFNSRDFGCVAIAEVIEIFLEDIPIEANLGCRALLTFPVEHALQNEGCAGTGLFLGTPSLDD